MPWGAPFPIRDGPEVLVDDEVPARAAPDFPFPLLSGQVASPDQCPTASHLRQVVLAFNASNFAFFWSSVKLPLTSKGGGLKAWCPFCAQTLLAEEGQVLLRAGPGLVLVDKDCPVIHKLRRVADMSGGIVLRGSPHRSTRPLPSRTLRR